MAPQPPYVAFLYVEIKKKDDDQYEATTLTSFRGLVFSYLL